MLILDWTDVVATIPEPRIVAFVAVIFLINGLVILAIFLIFLALLALFKASSTPETILSSKLYLVAASSNYLVLYFTIASIVSYFISVFNLLSTFFEILS